MRYEARWANSQWTVFDTHQYKPVRPVGTGKEAGRLADEMNRR